MSNTNENKNAIKNGEHYILDAQGKIADGPFESVDEAVKHLVRNTGQRFAVVRPHRLSGKLYLREEQITRRWKKRGSQT